MGIVDSDRAELTSTSIMTPNGSLIAYSIPADSRELRDQAALVSISWKEHLEIKDSENFDPQYSQSYANQASRRIIRPDALETLTMEFETRNLLVRYLQPKLLLVLEGGVPPNRKRSLKTTAEARGDARYPPEVQPESSNSSAANGTGTASSQDESALGTSVDSKASTATSSHTGGRMSALQVHRRKLDIMAETIKAELEHSGFSMPEDPHDRFF